MSNPQGRARAFLLTLLGTAVLAGITVALLGTFRRGLVGRCWGWLACLSALPVPGSLPDPLQPHPNQHPQTGIYGKDIFPQKEGAWEDPKLTYVKTPSLDALRADFDPDVCFDNYDLDWTSGKDGQVYVNTAPFFVKGACVRACMGVQVGSGSGLARNGSTQ